eukprot:6099437-Amphidinium_carterae.1
MDDLPSGVTFTAAIVMFARQASECDAESSLRLRATEAATAEEYVHDMVVPRAGHFDLRAAELELGVVSLGMTCNADEKQTCAADDGAVQRVTTTKEGMLINDTQNFQ